MATSTAYNKLITNLFSKVGNVNVTDTMKESFSSVIESKRTLNSIRTLEQLIKVLEFRDEINENDISVLRNIFEFLSKSQGNKDIFKYSSQLIEYYKTLNQTVEKEGTCTVCSAPSQAKMLRFEDDLQVPTALITNLTIQETKPAPNTEKTDFNVLDDAILEIEDRLVGPYWIKLARFLGVEDHQLDTLSAQLHIKPHSEVVHDMFRLWKNTKGSEATIETLINGLNHPRVLRRDLAERLKQKYKL